MTGHARFSTAVSLAALTALLASQPAFAQDANEAGDHSSPAEASSPGTPDGVEGEPIIVTGSRVERSGFTAPTPVTVVGAERLNSLGDSNVAQALNRLPAFRAQTTPMSQGYTQSNLGSEILDLRALGAQRTLVLLDGRRVVPSTTQGTFDIGLIPNAIISRVEVVTGGASAAYGSDAVAGVVNLITDTRLNGIRASAEYGISDRGDNRQVKLSAAFGSDLLDGRGHFVLAGEYVDNNGVGDCFSRSWCSPDGLSNYNVTTNSGGPGANGLPATVVGLVHNANMTPAGIINSTALRGTQFNADGSVSSDPFDFGINATPAALFMIGGDGANYFHRDLLISPLVDRYSLYGNLDYDFSDTLSGFVQASYGSTSVTANSATGFDFGFTSISRENAFLSDELAQLMDDAGVTQFNMGKITSEAGPTETQADRSTFRLATGLKGQLGGSWGWDAYYQYGETRNVQTSTNNKISANYTRAVDSVLVGDTPVCRSTLSDASNGCQPLNPFGVGNMSQAALKYAFGTGIASFRYRQHVLAANVRGEPFSTWAGPVSLATGVEYRRDTALGTTDAISAAGGFFTNNAAPIDGKIEVVEGYAETVVPLAEHLPFADTLELNGAVRQTHYSRSNAANATTSVDATTWKIGGVWAPVEPVRFRVTRSRDIRAPNMVELFSGLGAGLTFIQDSVTSQAYNVRTLTGGNPSLAPEKADTLTAGVVLTPPREWLGNLRFSVDYYDIDLDGAIAQLGGQLIVDRCIAGSAEYCGLVTRDGAGGLLTAIENRNLNLDAIKAKGFDFDLDYTVDLASAGSLNFRALATHVIDLTTIDSTGMVTDRAGQNGAPASQLSGMPNWTVDLTLTYENGPVTFMIQTHSLTGGAYNVQQIGPEDEGYSVDLSNSISDNYVEGRTYVNLAGSYDLTDAVQLFGSVTNLFDASPPVAPSSVGSYNPVLYDPVGRRYNIGVRATF